MTVPPASLTSEVFARTPTARTSRSKGIVFPLFIVAAPSSKRATLSPSRNAIPFSSRCFCTTAAQSASRMLDSTRSARSVTVIDPTRFLIPSAHFKPISPAPTIRTRASGVSAFPSDVASSSVIKLNFFPTVSSPSKGGTNGRDPVAIVSSS